VLDAMAVGNIHSKSRLIFNTDSVSTSGIQLRFFVFKCLLTLETDMAHLIQQIIITEFQVSRLFLPHAIRYQVGTLLESVDLYDVAC
jgi:hypothetical protein